MAERSLGATPHSTKLVSTFVIPDNYRAMGLAYCSDNTMWIQVFTWPMVMLIDSSGKVLRRGYVNKDVKNIIENSDSIFTDLDSWALESYRISQGLDGNCLVLFKEGRNVAIKEVNQSGKVSTVISGLDYLSIDGVAFISKPPPEKGTVLFGDCSKGLCSVTWPRSFLSSLFSSPVASNFDIDFDIKRVLSIAVDSHSDLLCLNDLNGRIVIFSRNGYKLAEYKPKEEVEFVNQSVMFDHTGCIIVHNLENSCVFRLTREGQVIQTLFPAIEDPPKFCESCNHSKIPTCPECRANVRITAVAINGHSIWIARLTGEVEIYELH